MDNPKEFTEKIKNVLIENTKRDKLGMFLFSKYGIGGTVQDEEDKAMYKQIYGREY